MLPIRTPLWPHLPTRFAFSTLLRSGPPCCSPNKPNLFLPPNLCAHWTGSLQSSPDLHLNGSLTIVKNLLQCHLLRAVFTAQLNAAHPPWRTYSLSPDSLFLCPFLFCIAFTTPWHGYCSPPPPPECKLCEVRTLSFMSPLLERCLGCRGRSCSFDEFMCEWFGQYQCDMAPWLTTASPRYERMWEW